MEILRKLRAHQLLDPLHRFHNRIVEIVNDGNPKTTLEELNHRVSADETGTTGDQDRLVRGHHFFESIETKHRKRDREFAEQR